MTIRINNLSLSLDDDISLLKKKVSKKLRISEKEIEDLRIVRESIMDAGLQNAERSAASAIRLEWRQCAASRRNVHASE